MKTISFYLPVLCSTILWQMVLFVWGSEIEFFAKKRFSISMGSFQLALLK